MWKRELLKNKIYAVLFILLGGLSVLIEYDATFFVFSLMIGLPLFFSKENWIYDGGGRLAVNPRKNAEGYSDPTAYQAIKNICKEEKRRNLKIVEVDKSIGTLVDKCDGYCPCSAIHTSDTKCICKDFRESIIAGKCHCGRFEKTSNVLCE